MSFPAWCCAGLLAAWGVPSLAIGTANETMYAYAKLSPMGQVKDMTSPGGFATFVQEPFKQMTVQLALNRLRKHDATLELRYYASPPSSGFPCVGLMGHGGGVGLGVDLKGNFNDQSKLQVPQLDLSGPFSVFGNNDISDPKSRYGKGLVVLGSDGNPLACAPIMAGARSQADAIFPLSLRSDNAGALGIVSFVHFGDMGGEVAVDLWMEEADDLKSTKGLELVLLGHPCSDPSNAPLEIFAGARAVGMLSTRLGLASGWKGGGGGQNHLFITVQDDELSLPALLEQLPARSPGEEPLAGLGLGIYTPGGEERLACADLTDAYYPFGSGTSRPEQIYFYPEGPVETVDPYYFNGGEAWIDFFVILYIFLVCGVSLFWIITRTKLSKSRNPDNSSQLMQDSRSFKGNLNQSPGFVRNAESTSNAPKNEMHGYQDHFVGKLAFKLLHSFSAALLLFYLVLVVDFYWSCEMHAPDSLCLYGSYPLLGKDMNFFLMTVLWWLFLIWFGGLLVTKPYLRNWCRVPCQLEDAHWVLIKAPKPTSKAVSLYPSIFVKWLRAYRRGRKANTQYFADTVPVQWTKRRERFISFHCSRFVLEGGEFKEVFPPLGSTIRALRLNKGLSSEDALRVCETVGPNEIPFSVDSMLEAIAKEFSRGFYLYQLLIYSVWIWWGYVVVGLCMLSVVLASGASAVFMARNGQKLIEKMTSSASDQEVLAYRSGRWTEVRCDELGPGDVVQIPSSAGGWQVPCDLILLHGVAVADESGLTGESRPVRKTCLPTDADEATGSLQFDPHTHAKHCLYSGTRVVQAEGGGGGGGHAGGTVAVGLVSATGTRTSKGELVKHILYPRDTLFKYDEELPIALGGLMVYGAFAFILASDFLASKEGEAPTFTLIFLYGIFTVSQVLSPLVPIALEVGQAVASKRLAAAGIFCVNTKRIPISGKVRLFCFDKTGTLTKEGLDFIGTHQALAGADGTLLVDPQLRVPRVPGVPAAFSGSACQAAAGISKQVLRGLTVCHTLTGLRSSNEGKGGHGQGGQGRGEELIGNEVEMRMFQATGWELVERPGRAPVVRPPGALASFSASSATSQELTILKRFDFDHHRMTMSVVIRDTEGECFVYCKGSSEAIGARCKPSSLPQHYMQVSKGHASQGCYVLSLAMRPLGRLSAKDCLEISRDEAENELEWCALVMFRNELKPDTAAALAKLKAGEVRALIVTGDNAQCGAYIARAAGLVSEASSLLLAEPNDDVKGRVSWSVVPRAEALAAEAREGHSLSAISDSGSNSGDGEGLRVKRAKAVTTSDILSDPRFQEAELAVTGKAFDILVASGEIEVLATRIRIFARMTPDGKVKVIDILSSKGLIVGMCGDGGNDCGALRCAHVGIALSDAEASVVSPFTSKTKSVESVVEVLREGRGALATSFAGYKFLITYGQLFSVVKLICLARGVIMCNMDYIFVDAIIIMSLTYTMTLALPLKELSPHRPTSSLLGPTTVFSVVGMQVIHLIFLGFALALIQGSPLYVRWPIEYTSAGDYWFLADNWECTVLFSCFAGQFMTSAVTFTFGGKFRRKVFFNHKLLLCWGVGYFALALVLLLPDGPLPRLFHMSQHHDIRAYADNPVWQARWLDGHGTAPPMPFSVRLGLFAIVVLSSLASIAWEKQVITGGFANWLMRTRPSKRPLLKL